MKKARTICLIAALAWILCAVIAGCGSNQDPSPTVDMELPAANSGKQPSQYTWEEYLAMDEAQKLEFQKSFGSMEIFEAWKEKAQRKENQSYPGSTEDSAPIDIPWERVGAKQPAQYTWEEFEALTAGQQILFQNSFSSFSDFEAWLEKAQDQTIDTPWEQGGKQPEQYTWAEFEALDADQQMRFQESFESMDAFDAWMQQAQYDVSGNDIELPWEIPGAKDPTAYTWEEFEALSAEEQMAFQNSFDDFEAFDAWLQQAQGENGRMPWDNGGKSPEEYTWAEFEALTAQQQIKFQSAFSTPEGFEQWLNENIP